MAPPRSELWRVTDRRTFRALREEGHRARGGPLTVTWLPGSDGTPPRVAFAIGRSIGSAVHRNRLRRRMRAAVRDAAAELQLQRGWLLIGAKPAASKHTFESLRGELIMLLARVTATSRP